MDVVTPREWSALDLWQTWRSMGAVGLPWPGSLMDQPCWELAAFGVLSAEASIIDAARYERQQREAKING